jgi:hypothetical protein
MLRDWIDKLLNWSGGAYVGLSTLVILGLAVAEYCNGAPVSIVGPDGKNVIYLVHRAPEWFTSAVGIYTIILTVFAMSRPINTFIAQKGSAPTTPPPAPAERPMEK